MDGTYQHRLMRSPVIPFPGILCIFSSIQVEPKVVFLGVRIEALLVVCKVVLLVVYKVVFLVAI